MDFFAHTLDHDHRVTASFTFMSVRSIRLRGGDGTARRLTGVDAKHASTHIFQYAMNLQGSDKVCPVKDTCQSLRFKTLPVFDVLHYDGHLAPLTGGSLLDTTRRAKTKLEWKETYCAIARSLNSSTEFQQGRSSDESVRPWVLVPDGPRTLAGPAICKLQKMKAILEERCLPQSSIGYTPRNLLCSGPDLTASCHGFVAKLDTSIPRESRRKASSSVISWTF